MCTGVTQIFYCTWRGIGPLTGLRGGVYMLKREAEGYYALRWYLLQTHAYLRALRNHRVSP